MVDTIQIMKNKTIQIYILIDPRNNFVKYIGKTVTKLKYRLSQHLCEKRKNKRTSWITSLKKQNLVPIIELLDEIPFTEDWEWLEQYWISQFKTWGFSLLNMTNGGDGNKNQTFSKESILKRANSIKEGVKSGRINYKVQAEVNKTRMTGRVVSDITKEKIRQANLNKKYSLETKLKKSKAVTQFDLKGFKLGEFYCINEAARVLNLSKGSISNCCKGRCKTSGGFIWKYSKDIV